MSWQASGYVKGLTLSPTGEKIERGEKFILLLLADYTNPETGYANPSIPRLAEEGLYEKRQVLRIIESLEKKGFISVKRSSAAFPGNNRYSILGLVTKCHKGKRLVDKPPCDIDSDISNVKMSPEPKEAKEPIKTNTYSLPFSEENPPEPINPSGKKQKEEPALPEWIPVDAWDGFFEMRAKKKVPRTGRAETGIINELRKLSSGNRELAGLILDQSTMRGWSGVFPLTDNGNGKSKQPEPISMLEAERQREENFKKLRRQP